jgi:hypothetical protein
MCFCGHKIRTMYTSVGYCFKFELYYGKMLQMTLERKCHFGLQVVLNMLKQTGNPEGHILYRVSVKECIHFKHLCWEINRARRVQFSPHETAIQKVLPPPPQPFFSSQLFELSFLSCSHNVHLAFKCPEIIASHLRHDSFHRIDDEFFQICKQVTCVWYA